MKTRTNHTSPMHSVSAGVVSSGGISNACTPAAKKSASGRCGALANYGADTVAEVIVRAEGSYIYTKTGRRVLDWTSGQMCSILGHCHPEIYSTLHTASTILDHLSSCMLSEPVIDLASRLTSLLPPGLDKAVFYSTGSESNDAAIRMAKMYTGKFEIVALGQSWHGMTRQAQGAQYHDGRKGHGPQMPGQFMLPQPNSYRSVFRHADGSHDWETEMSHGWDMIDHASCGSLAACIVECIQGDGGIHVLPAGYLAALKRHCEDRGMLLIVDEAQTALGRTGELFALDHEDVVPDILTLSKPLANGLPLSALITSSTINAECESKGFLFFTTHTNEPLIAAVANKTLEIVLRDDLAANSRERGRQLLDGLCNLRTKYECIGDVRGRGLMAGIEIVGNRSWKTPDPELARRLSQAMWQLGTWCQLQGQRVFRIGPPLNSTPEQIADGLSILDRAFAAVTQER